MLVSRRTTRMALVTCLAVAGIVLVGPASGAATSRADTALQRALDAFVKRADGTRSAVVSINGQITPERNPKIFPALRAIYGLAVCSALKG
jgi:hypothetical protein